MRAQTADPRLRSPVVLTVAVVLISVGLVECCSHVIFPALFPGWGRSGHLLLSYLTLALCAAPLLYLVVRHHSAAIADIHRLRTIQTLLSNFGDDMVLHVGNDGLATWVSESFTRVTGWTVEDLLRIPWEQRTHPDDVPLCRSIRSACIAEHKAGSGLYRVMLRDGRYLWVETLMLPLFDHRGRPDGFVSRSMDVSKFMTLRDEVRTQADRVNLAQRAGHVGLWEANITHRRVALSEMACELLGLQPGADLSFDDFKLRIHPEDLPRSSEAFSQVRSGGSGRSLSVRIRTEHRGMRWMEFTATGVATQRIMGTCSDVTEQVEQRERLASSESRLLAFVEQAPVALAMVDVEFRCHLASRRWYQLFRPTPELAVGESVLQAVPDVASRWEEGLRRLRAGEASVTGEGRVRGLDGVEQWLRWELRPWRDSAGEIGGAVISVEDIGETLAAQREVDEARAMLEEAQAIARVGSWSFELATGKVTWSKEIYRLFCRDEALGPPDYAWVLSSYEPESAARLDAAVRRAVTDGIGYELILRPSVAMPGVRVMRARARPVFGPDGRGVSLLVGTVADVTAEVEREDELRRARESADRGNRAKSEFLASMSHEIRTPMTAILGYAELLVVDPELQADVQRVRAAAETIRSNGKHLLAILNDILDLSKIEAGKLEVEHLPTNVAGLLYEVVHLLAPTARAKGLSLDLSSELPAGQLLLLDPIRLRQIAVNLLSNAVKFTQTGSVRVRAMLTAGSAGTAVGDRTPEPAGTLVIQVEDTGIGMTEEQVARLFRSFEQGDATTARRFGGTGLGLRISSRLAELMGGRLEASSSPGAGSLFTVSLPGVLAQRRPAVAVVPGATERVLGAEARPSVREFG